MEGFVNHELIKLTIQCDEILKQLGRNKIGLSMKESARKRFCNFIRDFGIYSIAHIDYKYKSFRYFLDVENEKWAKLLFEHVTVWHGNVEGEDKLYFVSQPFRSYEIQNAEDVLQLLLEEKKFLEWCRESGHHLMLHFDNNYNWRDEEAFLIILELDNEGNSMDFLDIIIVDWGIQSIYHYEP